MCFKTSYLNLVAFFKHRRLNLFQYKPGEGVGEGRGGRGGGTNNQRLTIYPHYVLIDTLAARKSIWCYLNHPPKWLIAIQPGAKKASFPACPKLAKK